MVKNSSDNLMSLISDILDFSKIEAGKLKIEESPMNIQNIVEDTISLLAESCNLKKLSLLYFVDAKFPVIGDPGRFRQVLVNLVGNAIKFTEKGFVKIEICVISKEESRALIKCRVSDSGIGIPEQLHKYLFIPFSQVGDTSTIKRYGGTGLGLAICKQIVHYFGGEIGLNSNPNIGSTFWFTMALKKSLLSASFSHSSQDVLENIDQNLKICSLDTQGPEHETLVQWFRQWKTQVAFFSSMEEAIHKKYVVPASVVVSSGPYCDVIFLVWTENSCKILVDFFHKTKFVPKNLGILLVGFPSETVQDFPAHVTVYALPKPAKRNKLFQLLLHMTNPVSKPTLSMSPSIDIDSEQVSKRQKQKELVVMVVEDNIINQKVLVRQLEKLGCDHSVIANHGIEALDLYDKTENICLILMDIQVKNGFFSDSFRCQKWMG
jgi:hypothetical protein